jgi:hypothetical protein
MSLNIKNVYILYPTVVSDNLGLCGVMHHSLYSNACCIYTVIENAWRHCVFD